jgi:myo-inositol-1-phosphate synthase
MESMTENNLKTYQSLLLMVAGAKGTVASTLSVAAAASRRNPESVLPYLTTRDRFTRAGIPLTIEMAGWDVREKNLTEGLEKNGVLPENMWKPYCDDIAAIPIKAWHNAATFKDQVDKTVEDMAEFRERHPHSSPVFVNLLPAGADLGGSRIADLEQLYSTVNPSRYPDLSFITAAVLAGIPVVNFTPNNAEIPVIIKEAEQRKVTLAGRDGKTGQTYLKTVIASALKARNLCVDGWYSLNILGNSDGMNLMDPERAAGKLRNKTDLLDQILGYPVENASGASTHKVHIDYYPPRGDAKEAWDVIDMKGLFGLPMSIRVNLQGRDSILAAPLAIDLARWAAALQAAGRWGTVPELGFYFKKPLGDNPPLTFQDQMDALDTLEQQCNTAAKE